MVNLDETNLKQEEQHITHSLKSNGYSIKFLKEVKKKIKCETTRNTSEIEKEFKGLAVLPYIEGTTEKLKRVLQNHNIKVAMKPVSILKNYLMRPKDVIPTCKQTGVIYSIPCKECEIKYIGETGRSLETRQKEHQRSVRLAKTKDSALAEHVYNNNHSIDWNNSKISNKESHWFKGN